VNAIENRAKAVFLEALEIGQPERWDDFLQGACGEDAVLLRRVKVLLDAHRGVDSLLDSPDIDPTITMASATANVAGTVIGPYRLMEQIGEGGMGVVYVAEQAQPVRRKVALKVIKPGMDSKQVIARFEAERQALALMDHPNIAKVLDAGATPSGRPYFVMELVRGIPITEYCDREQLSITERLELFVLVCRAVQHAHQKGVIHRDLKPSNVLVTVVDGVGVPKVIDFGVAKATGQALTDKTLFTGFHQFVGTPLYVSPEQADLSGVDVDTRSDIYSLGVLLYELLTGTTPFDRETFGNVAFDEMRRILREEEPPKPSTRLSSLGASRSTVSANRRADTRHLGRTVRGDLDWIVMKSLEKDRRRRFETANDFAADVMRFLTDRPVEACPPSAWYRFTKFVRRHRSILFTAFVVAAALLGGTAVSLRQAAVANAARREAEKQEARAEANFALARNAVDDTVTRVFDEPRLKEADFYELRHHLLTGAVPLYEELVKQRGDDPRIEADRARAYGKLGAIRRETGDLVQARVDLERSCEIAARLAEAHPREPSYRQGLALQLRQHGLLLRDLKQGAASEAVYRRALTVDQGLAVDFPEVPGHRDDLAEGRNQLGVLLLTLGRRAEAEAEFRQSLGVRRRLSEEYPVESGYVSRLAMTLNNLGTVLRETGRKTEALEVFRESLAIRERLSAGAPKLQQNRLGLQLLHGNLARLLEDTGRRADALTHMQRSRDVAAALAADFPGVPVYRRRLATTHSDLGILLSREHRYREAEVEYREALAIQSKLADDSTSDPTHTETLGSIHGNLGVLLTEMDRPAEAEAAYRKALAINEQMVKDHPGPTGHAVNLGGNLCNIANLLRDDDRLLDSLAWYDRAMRTLEDVVRQEPRLAIARKFLRNAHIGRARTLGTLGRRDEAGTDWDRALELAEGPGRSEVLAGRALALADADPTRAVSEAEALLGAKDLSPDALFLLARVYSLGSAGAGEGDERDRLAARAMRLLHQAHESGQFKSPREMARLNNCKYLEPIRGREDFLELLDLIERDQSLPPKS
jgi:serine/threonine protein kinase/tetratricopeptide (TPR) repeat protein